MLFYHVTNAELKPGDILVTGHPPSTNFYEMLNDSGTLKDMGRPRSEFVWITAPGDLEDAYFWQVVLCAKYVYRVVPRNAQPWNGTGCDGWVCDTATVIERIEREAA